MYKLSKRSMSELVGVQYGFSYGALNIKSSYKGRGEYIIGSGFVVGF